MYRSSAKATGRPVTAASQRSPVSRTHRHLALSPAGVDRQADDDPIDLVLFHQVAVVAGVVINTPAHVNLQRRGDRSAGIADRPADSPQPEVQPEDSTHALDRYPAPTVALSRKNPRHVLS